MEVHLQLLLFHPKLSFIYVRTKSNLRGTIPTYPFVFFSRELVHLVDLNDLCLS